MATVELAHPTTLDGLRKPLGGLSGLLIHASLIAEVRQLLDVVHQAIQLPLRAHLGAASPRETIEPLGVPDVGKLLLHRGHALAV